MSEHFYKFTDIMIIADVGSGTLLRTIKRLDIWPIYFDGPRATKPRYSLEQLNKIKDYTDKLKKQDKIHKEKGESC